MRFREAVAATGIEVEMKPTPRSREHVSGDEFQRQADRLKEGLEDVEATEATLDVWAASLDARAANLDAREADVNKRDEATRRDRRTLNAEIRRHNEQDAALKIRAADWAEPDGRGQGEGEGVKRRLARAGAEEAGRAIGYSAGLRQGMASVQTTIEAAEAVLAEVESYRDKVTPKFQQVIDQNNSAARRKTARLQAIVEQHTHQPGTSPYSQNGWK